MFQIDDDMTIYITRGDVAYFSVTADNNGVPYKFKPGDVVRMKVFAKKDAANVVLQKDFPITVEVDHVNIYLEEKDTKIGEVISKPVDYWYEVELNPFTNPQTIVGYDDDGAKIFKLFPEGRDLTSTITEEDIPLVDDELSLTSERPVQNQAVTRALVRLEKDCEHLHEVIEKSVDEWFEESEEKLEEDVDKWLTEHPEATTTVQDGSLSVDKFTEEAKLHILNGYVTPQMFGAKGDGVTDDTLAIQAAFNENKSLFFPPGDYMISDTIVIPALTNKHIDAENANFIYSGTSYAFEFTRITDTNLYIGTVQARNGNGIHFACDSDNNYSQYVNVYFRSITAKEYCVRADITGGWINEIRFHDGYFFGKYGCYMNISAIDECTGWRFFNTSFEAAKTGVYLTGTPRFRDVELMNVRYGDSTDFAVLHVACQVHNLKLNTSFPFYNRYLVNEGTIFNSELNVPIYDELHRLLCRNRYYDANGALHNVGFINTKTQASFNDCTHATSTRHASISVGNEYCASNNIMGTYYAKIKCNEEVVAWSTLLTLPLSNVRIVGGGVHVYIPSINEFRFLYVNTDGKITTETTLPSGAEFILNFTVIRNQT